MLPLAIPPGTGAVAGAPGNPPKAISARAPLRAAKRVRRHIHFTWRGNRRSKPLPSRTADDCIAGAIWHRPRTAKTECNRYLVLSVRVGLA